MPVIVDGELEARKLMNLSLSLRPPRGRRLGRGQLHAGDEGPDRKPDQAPQRLRRRDQAAGECPGSVRGKEPGLDANVPAGGMSEPARTTEDRQGAGPIFRASNCFRRPAARPRPGHWRCPRRAAPDRRLTPSARTNSGSMPMKLNMRLQIGLDMLEAVAGLVEAAARNGDDHALVAGQAFGAVGAIAEGLAGHGDAVDPRLELARDGEIIHRRADHDRVGGKEFVEHVGVAEPRSASGGRAARRRGRAR